MQYVLDVLFLTPRPDVECSERVVISVIVIRRYIYEAAIVSSYYTFCRRAYN